MFERHTTVTTARDLPYSATQVLKIVHDPEQLIRLNPLVVGVRRVPATPPPPSTMPAAADAKALPEGADDTEEEEGEMWEIDDRQLLCGVIPLHWTYTAAFRNTAQGVVVNPRAGMGVRLRNVWTLSPRLRLQLRLHHQHQAVVMERGQGKRSRDGREWKSTPRSGHRRGCWGT